MDLRVHGLIPDDETHLNGFFAEYMIVRADSTFFVVNDLSLELRMLIEPAAVVVHALERAKSTGLINFRSRVLVQGCGPIGLLMLAAVRAAGVQHIIALDGDDSRLEMARQMGAESAINYKKHAGPEGVTEAIKAATRGRGAHFAFQCTGVPLAASNIWKYVQRGGGICEVGFFVDNGTCEINPHRDICAKEISYHLSVHGFTPWMNTQSPTTSSAAPKGSGCPWKTSLPIGSRSIKSKKPCKSTSGRKG